MTRNLILISFSAAALVSAVTAITARQLKWRSLYKISKPLTTILIIIISLIIRQTNTTNYSTVIIPSLIFSLAGDIFLIGGRYFIAGLAAFLMAHIGFIIAFSGLFGFYTGIFPFLILLMIGTSYFWYLRKDLGRFTLPVLAYLTIILIMNWQAVGLFVVQPVLVNFGIALASILFLFSDSVIAWDKFREPLKYSGILTLITYWPAIYLFALAGLFLD